MTKIKKKNTGILKSHCSSQEFIPKPSSICWHQETSRKTSAFAITSFPHSWLVLGGSAKKQRNDKNKKAIEIRRRIANMDNPQPAPDSTQESEVKELRLLVPE